VLLRGRTKAATGISLNEDNSHYYVSRPGQKVEAETVTSFIDQYAGTGSKATMASKPRRHVLTYAAIAGADQRLAFRIHTGPRAALQGRL